MMLPAKPLSHNQLESLESQADMERSKSPIKRLYSPGQVALASFLGSPISACWFMRHNFRQLGQPKNARHCLIWGSVATILLLTIAFFLPDGFPTKGLIIGYTVGLFQIAKHLQGKSVAQHI